MIVRVYLDKLWGSDSLDPEETVDYEAFVLMNKRGQSEQSLYIFTVSEETELSGNPIGTILDSLAL